MLSQWETGKKKDLALKSLLSIAKALNVSVEVLLDGVDPEYSRQRTDGQTPRARLLELCASLNDAQARSVIPVVLGLLHLDDRADSPSDEERT